VGAANQVAVVAKHFPGHGGAPRRPDQEVPTIRKSLEELVNFDLVPFFAVTGHAPNALTTADALLASHIRFQGFQSNIRQNTQPLSFDATALGELLALPQLTAWHTDGLLVSDALGARAIKRFYDPTETTFNNRRIARDAFNAGNDVLMFTDFGLVPRVDQTATIIDTLNYFVQVYEADPEFAARVDVAVTRILKLKLRLSGGQFDPAQALLPENGLAKLNQNNPVLSALAQTAAVLVNPSAEELLARVPDPPAATERMVFFTDARQSKPCATCAPAALIDKRAFEQTVLQIYGPSGSGQVRVNNLHSFTFDDLLAYLTAAPLTVGPETPTPPPAPIAQALEKADWVVFNLLNVTPEAPGSSALSVFLAQQPTIVRNKKIVVFAFDAPYFLNTTELSKITAYYALFSHTPAFVNVAARLLFRDLTPHGYLPISVKSAGYNLSEITRPDPRRVIDLNSVLPPQLGEGTPAPTGLRLGDVITVTTGVIRDHNGLPVPDQTPVRFQVLYRNEGLAQFFDTATRNGIASFALSLNREGPLEITASSDPAQASVKLQINVESQTSFAITQVRPTDEPTRTAAPTDTPTPPSPTPMPTPTPTPTPPPLFVGRVAWPTFLGMLVILAGIAFGGYLLGANLSVSPSATQRASAGWRVALLGAVGALLGYNWYALGLPGVDFMNALAPYSATLLALLGGAFGLLVGWWWIIAPMPAAH
jgi:beta-N-acetylhexosaminidase